MQQHIHDIQALPHVGTRGILSRGRRRSEDSILDSFLNIDSQKISNGEDKELHLSPNKMKLCTDDENNTLKGGEQASRTSFAPVLLRPSSPITKQSAATVLEDAESCMKIDVNFQGYSNNKSTMMYSNRGASLETESDKNVLHAFSSGGELEKKFGSKEERIKSLPRAFQKRMPSFSYSNCSYKVPTSKLSTSRAVMALEVGIECSYTLEISLAGDSKRLFQPTDLLNIGKAMGKSLHDWMQPALGYLETKRKLEEQERARQEQLDAYFAYNSKNKDREAKDRENHPISNREATSRPQSGVAARSRPQSANLSRSRPQSSSNIVNLAAPGHMMDDLNVVLYGAPVKTRSSKPTLGAEHRRDDKKKKLSERLPRDSSSKNKPVKSKSNGGEKAVKDAARNKKDKPLGESESYHHRDQAFIPTLSVKVPAPEYIMDSDEKCDILNPPVKAPQMEASSKKLNSTVGFQ